MKSWLALIICVLSLSSASGGLLDLAKGFTPDGIIQNLINANRYRVNNIYLDKVNLREFGSLTDVQINTEDSLQVQNLEASGLTEIQVMNITIIVPTASLTASFNFKNLTIPKINISGFGRGKLSGSLELLFATLKAKLRVKPLQFTAVLEDFSDLFVYIQDITADVTGDIVRREDLINILSNDLAPFLSTEIAIFAEDPGNKAAIIKSINKLLADKDSFDVKLT